jgi:hypothetical protein
MARMLISADAWRFEVNTFNVRTLKLRCGVSQHMAMSGGAGAEPHALQPKGMNRLGRCSFMVQTKCLVRNY